MGKRRFVYTVGRRLQIIRTIKLLVLGKYRKIIRTHGCWFVRINGRLRKVIRGKKWYLRYKGWTIIKRIHLSAFIERRYVPISQIKGRLVTRRRFRGRRIPIMTKRIRYLRLRRHRLRRVKITKKGAKVRSGRRWSRLLKMKHFRE